MKEDCTSFVLERTFTFSNTQKDEIKERESKMYSLYLILLNQVLLASTSLSVRMLRTHSILYSLLFSTLLGSCSYHISVCMNPSFEHDFQWITLPRLSCFSCTFLCQNATTSYYMGNTYPFICTESAENLLEFRESWILPN